MSARRLWQIRFPRRREFRYAHRLPGCSLIFPRSLRVSCLVSRKPAAPARRYARWASAKSRITLHYRHGSLLSGVRSLVQDKKRQSRSLVVCLRRDTQANFLGMTMGSRGANELVGRGMIAGGLSAGDSASPSRGVFPRLKTRSGTPGARSRAKGTAILRGLQGFSLLLSRHAQDGSAGGVAGAKSRLLAAARWQRTARSSE